MHQHSVVACARIVDDGNVIEDVRTFETTTKGLLELSNWLEESTKDTYLRAQFHRLKSRVGAMKAVIAVAASMLTAVFHMVTDGVPYRELGGSFLDRREVTKVAKRLERRLEGLGLQVTVTPAA